MNRKQKVAIVVGALVIAGLCVASCGEDGPPPREESAAEVPPPDPTPAPTPLPEPPPWPELAKEQHDEAERLGVPVKYENHLGMRFVLIPAGTFRMGSPLEEVGRYDGENQHDVTISSAYYMQITEVTNAQYRRFVQDHEDRTNSADYRPGDEPGTVIATTRLDRARAYDGDDQPAVWVSWTAATEFADWLTSRDSQRLYRLPTEAEWERACRAGTSTRFWWGDQASEGWKYENALDPATKEAMETAIDGWPRDDGFVVSAPVARYPHNGWGLHDMLGNVAEWCSDWCARVLPRTPLTDPVGPESAEYRVIRGGWWREQPERVRCAFRNGVRPSRLGDGIGFRLVSTLWEKEE